MMQGTQQLSKPVEGPELPADPHKVQPLQPETRPAITRSTAGREEDREKKKTHKYLLKLFTIYQCMIFFTTTLQTLTAERAAHRRTA